MRATVLSQGPPLVKPDLTAGAGFLLSPKAAHRLNLNPEKNILDCHILGLFAPFRHRVKPPVDMLGKQFARMLPLNRVLRLRNSR